MVKINLPNFVTVGLMGLIGVVALKWGLGAMGIKPTWL
jgi:hypothetical protein